MSELEFLGLKDGRIERPFFILSSYHPLNPNSDNFSDIMKFKMILLFEISKKENKKGHMVGEY